MIDPSKTLKSIERIKGYFKDAAKQAMTLALREAEKSARDTTAFYDRTGGTRNTFKATANSSGLSGRLIGRKAARFLEFGTRDHGPVTAPYLRFQINGQWVRARWVRGIKPMRFMQHAANIGQQTLKYSLAYYINQALRRR